MKTRYKIIENKLYLLFLSCIVISILFLLLGTNLDNFRFFVGIRFPKLLAIILSSICIGISTLIFQTITNSRILTPNIMGLDAMFVFLQTIIFFIFYRIFPILYNDVAKFFITVIAMIFITTLLQKLFSGNSKGRILYMVLIGMVTGTFLTSLSSAMQVMMDPNEFLILQSSLIASYNKINPYLLICAYVILFIVLFFIRDDYNKLDVLGLGYEQSINLGLEYNELLRKYLVIIGVLISISTALIGPITFLGLVTVNIAKVVFPTYRHIYLVIGAVLLNIVFLLCGQFVAEKLFNNNFSVGTIINFVGGIYLLVILLKERKLV